VQVDYTTASNAFYTNPYSDYLDYTGEDYKRK
jgi:hypothetical protein